MQQQFEHLRPQFIAVHDIATASSQKLLAGMAAAGGRAVQKLRLWRRLGRHSYEGLAFEPAERERLVAALGALDGLILANYGRINLDAADRAFLDFDGNGLIQVEVTGELRSRLDAAEPAVSNRGELRAEGGTVVLQASAARDLFTNLINNSGVIDAGGISTEGGVVRLIGSGGNVENSGVIRATGTEGGSIQVLSDRDVLITGNAVIDASGSNGGGDIRIGGGIQGGEGLTQAERTYVAADATISADATGNGDGGSVVVFSKDATVIAGELTARGGVAGGNGGFVETSGLAGFAIAQAPDVGARSASGTGGEWLIDPYNLTIVAGGGNTNINAGNPFAATGDTASLGVDLITGALVGGNTVTVSTGAGGGQNGDITLDTTLDYDGTGAGTLVLNADGRGDGPLLNATEMVAGRWRLLFEVAPYFRARGAEWELFDDIVFATGFDAMTGALLGVDIRGHGAATGFRRFFSFCLGKHWQGQG